MHSIKVTVYLATKKVPITYYNKQMRSVYMNPLSERNLQTENKYIIAMEFEHKANIISVEVILFIGFQTFGSSKMLKV